MCVGEGEAQHRLGAALGACAAPAAAEAAAAAAARKLLGVPPRTGRPSQDALERSRIPQQAALDLIQENLAAGGAGGMGSQEVGKRTQRLDRCSVATRSPRLQV
jgi:hypothetical protein